MKHNGFLLLCAKSKVQNVVVVASCVQNLEAKQQSTKAKQKHKSKIKKKCVEHLGLQIYLSIKFFFFSSCACCIQNQVESRSKIKKQLVASKTKL